MNKKQFTIFILIIIGILFPLFVNFITNYPSAIKVAGDEGDWISFWGSYTGSIISVLGVYLTMKNDNENRLKERREDVKPYLILQSALPSQFLNQNSEFIFTRGYHIYFNKNPNKIDLKDNYYSNYFIIKNEGLGLAIDIEFECCKLRGSNFGNFCILKESNNFPYHIGIKEDLYNHNYPFLIIKFHDIYGNRYSQKFRIAVSNNFNEASLFITKAYPPKLIKLAK